MSVRELSDEELVSRVATGEILAQQPLDEEARRVLDRQLSELRNEVARREGVPAPVVIGLKTAHLDAVLLGGM